MGRAKLVGLALVLTAGGCSLLTDLDGLAGSPPGSAVEGGADAPITPNESGADVGPMTDAPLDTSADAPSAPGCGGIAGRGPTMVKVGQGFCIDTTEVTQSQYAAFVASRAGDTSGQATECDWNTSFAPLSGTGCAYDPQQRGTHPVTGLDFCDAVAFCKWSGKRLCGHRTPGATLVPADYDDPVKAEWFFACTNLDDGQHTYPYGQTYNASTCAGADRPGGIVPVQSLAGCQGGVPGVYDMSGNAFEWIDSCFGKNGPEDTCILQGGSFLSAAQNLRCVGIYNTLDRNMRDCQTGVRCCAAYTP